MGHRRGARPAQHGSPLPVGAGAFPASVPRRPPRRRARSANGLPGGSTSPRPDHEDRQSTVSAGLETASLARQALHRARPALHRRFPVDSAAMSPVASNASRLVHRSRAAGVRSAGPPVEGTSARSLAGGAPLDRSFVEIPTHAVRGLGAAAGPEAVPAGRSAPLRSVGAAKPPDRAPAALSGPILQSRAATMAGEVRGPARSAPGGSVPRESPTVGRSAAAPHRSPSVSDGCRDRAGNALGPESAA